ncbi:MAG: SDR family NAD(P)-dependent oxidoreductase [Saprospirales bacterium]|nr:SDR family NAD(P)-dependent oxidoreductase [Saprospirales bacterium]
MKLKDKVAIVTGSSMGIGRAIARRLGEEGATVVLNGRDTAKLARTHFQLSESGIEADSFPADISSPEDCRQLIVHTLRKYGRIDILINNAGISSKGFFEDTHPEIFQQVVDVNLLGSLYATREALPHIKASKGHILFISSLAGLRGIPFQCPYCLSKMAQTALAESLRAELYQKGTHVGIIYVGITKNDPEKRIIFSDGSWKSLPERNHPFAATRTG